MSDQAIDPYLEPAAKFPRVIPTPCFHPHAVPWKWVATATSTYITHTEVTAFWCPACRAQLSP